MGHVSPFPRCVFSASHRGLACGWSAGGRRGAGYVARSDARRLRLGCASSGRAASALAQAQGGSAFPLDQERGYWRVHLEGGIQHDFVPLPDDLTSDLLRRDFTVNALALDEAGRWHDPTGGQADLRARRLRMVSAHNLHADPLRAWRAARFEVTLGFRMDAATEQAVRQVAADRICPLAAPACG